MRAEQIRIIEAINTSPYNRGLDGLAWLQADTSRPIVFKNGDVMLFNDCGDQIFDVHFLFDKARGRAALDQAKVGFGSMFQQGARLLFGHTPLENRKARIFNRLLGCKSVGLVETEFGKCEKFVMTFQAWKAN